MQIIYAIFAGSVINKGFGKSPAPAPIVSGHFGSLLGLLTRKSKVMTLTLIFANIAL
jgi:hypothetical protein